MELSYTAYNYPSGEELPDIPGDFMGDVDKPATTFLAEHGFENVSYYNYDPDYSVAYVMAHKNIKFSTQGIVQENTEGDLNNGISSSYISANSGFVDRSIYVGSDTVGGTIVSDIHTDTSNQGIFSSITSTSSNSGDAEFSDIRPLVVVDIRGSVTIPDWIMNFCTQFHNKLFEFEDGADDAIETLCGYGGCTECTGEDESCDCHGYLNDINNPVMLVTGHSLGAAVANLISAMSFSGHCTFFNVWGMNLLSCLPC